MRMRGSSVHGTDYDMLMMIIIMEELIIMMMLIRLSERKRARERKGKCDCLRSDRDGRHLWRRSCACRS